MEKEVAIEFKNVSKIYKLKSKNHKHSDDKRFYALKNISFQIDKGDVVGILGTNGSGKSTMAVVLAGISEIDEGEMVVNGEQALIAINTGLNSQLTGMENIELKGALLGFSKKRVKEIVDEVMDFAEIGDFIYQPVKKYSSGMKSRLGFSINLALNPDILIVDEALSVGDKAFSQKCINKMKELKGQGKTIVFVSHSLAQVKSFCNKALWIEGGQFREFGDITEVTDHYAQYVEYYNGLTKKEQQKERDRKFAERVIDAPKKKKFWGLIG